MSQSLKFDKCSRESWGPRISGPRWRGDGLLLWPVTGLLLYLPPGLDLGPQGQSAAAQITVVWPTLRPQAEGPQPHQEQPSFPVLLERRGQAGWRKKTVAPAASSFLSEE